MIFRDFLSALEDDGLLVQREDSLSRELAAADAIREAGDRPVLLLDVDGWPVAANLLASRSLLARGLELDEEDLAKAFAEALAAPVEPPPFDGPAPCQTHVIHNPDLGGLPVLRHYAQEGGPFITAGVMIVSDPDTGLNAAYHRLMITSHNRFAARLVEGRGTDTALGKTEGPLDAVVCIGPPVELLLAGAASVPEDVNELAMAHALGSLRVTRAVTCDLPVPAETEWVFEGRLLHETAPEGPFVDITRTLDGVRSQPIFEVTCVTHREDPYFHAVLPAGPEHRTLMGLPRELAVLSAVAEVAEVRDFHLTPGGSGWLTGVLSLVKPKPDSVRQAVKAAFETHRSLKILVVVDEDVDPRNSQDVAWAIATRLQPARDLEIVASAPSSSLDPSALHPPKGRVTTSKMILDATIKPGSDRSTFKSLYD